MNPNVQEGVAEEVSESSLLPTYLHLKFELYSILS